MRAIRDVLLAVWWFVVGDDWRIALGVAAAIGATALLADAGAPSWWVLPVAVAGMLAGSLAAERRRSRGRG